MVPIIPQVLAMRTPAELQQAVNRAVDQLHETQDRLVRNEKMASLGALVAGVSHEINTPVGIGVTAASALQEQSSRIAREFAAGNLKKSELEHFLRVSAETSDIILRNRGTRVVVSFPLALQEAAA
jgi:two-component system, NtrC family, sensor kinase